MVLHYSGPQGIFYYKNKYALPYVLHTHFMYYASLSLEMCFPGNKLLFKFSDHIKMIIKTISKTVPTLT